MKLITSNFLFKTLKISLPVAFLYFVNFHSSHAAESHSAIKTSVELYENNQFEGALVQPTEIKGKRPAILMIHNWLGVSDETKFQAQRFADLGYIVFAADIFGKGVRPMNAQDAGKLSGQYKSDRKLFKERLNLALNHLKSIKNVDPKNIVAVGYCFGGTGVIELARSGADIKAAISFHGGLDSPSPAEGKNIKTKILALHGADDPYVKKTDLDAFEKEMKDNQINYQLVKYPGAVHSFTDKSAGTDNSKGAAYNKDADEKSFAAAKEFLKSL